MGARDIHLSGKNSVIKIMVKIGGTPSPSPPPLNGGIKPPDKNEFVKMRIFFGVIIAHFNAIFT